MDTNWKDYFTFTKKERIGIYLLLTGIGICSILPRFFNSPSINTEVTAEALALHRTHRSTMQKELARLSSKDQRMYDEPVNDQVVATLFPFDPNTLDAAGWKKLGIRDRTINTILRYRAKGGHFKHAADLQKVYGLKKADVERLMPYVQIAPPVENSGKEEPRANYVKAAAPIIDINEADTMAFISLPGIGSKLASRIVHFREKLGGFYSIQQVGETFGLPDSTFQLIRPRLQCSRVALQKININTADVHALKQHPYIRWNIANAIVQYRQQHGAFHSPEELQQIVLITPELYQKIAAYVAVD
ncbi:ComEA family DNA-binding protein [Longitalea luteola]|uniref:ComEA family DNA-binding protein n=1 Tax=Longitalea luteola TaxID=2812563 RepID=UPI001A95F3B8|nr:helix-hairpin-helix domain-containing protein [Longitalea luteola]